MNTPQVPADRPPALLVATRKGAWMFHADVDRRYWRVDGPHFLGHIIALLQYVRSGMRPSSPAAPFLS